MPIRVRDKDRPRSITFIREWRLHRKLTQTQLAKQIDTTAATISRIETGELPYTQDTLEQIADVLQTSPAALIASRPDDQYVRLCALVDRAKPAQRQQIARVVRALLASPEDSSTTASP